MREKVDKDGVKKKKLSGSLTFKIFIYFLLAFAFITAAVAGVGSVLLGKAHAYQAGGFEKLTKSMMQEVLWQDYYTILNVCFSEGITEDSLKPFADGNLSFEIYEGDKLLFTNYDGKDTAYTFAYTDKLTERSEELGLIRLYVDPDFPAQDKYQLLYRLGQNLYELRVVLPAAAIIGALLCIICFIFLMCGAGHKNGCEGITLSVLSPIHFDILTIGFGLVGVFVGIMVTNLFHLFEDWLTVLVFIVLLTLELVWFTVFCAEFALRLKRGGWWRHTLVYVVLRRVWRILCSVGNFLKMIITGLPLVLGAAIVFLGICILEFLGILIFCSVEVFVLWALEKCVLFPIVLYVALVCKRLQEGSEALAEGNLTYKIDTSKMFLAFKEHGENLNSIGQGMTRAVEERMKSERLKTELITNVSHDLKTPLTSIINYADLLGNKNLEQDKVSEYAQVLLRQSKRLKKLLDDLMEVSKATTGNLEVQLERCEVGVLLTQAAGEYEKRFEEKALELITDQPEKPVYIQADGRRLWRVFDNLLNNICKYAQENSRVYLSLEQREGQAYVIFRNMSKYALNIPAQELEERFVRGDKSRHMEGNGLGLSIAKSLVELQNGKMEIVTDGDLFKVILTFPVE